MPLAPPACSSKSPLPIAVAPRSPAAKGRRPRSGSSPARRGRSRSPTSFDCCSWPAELESAASP
eukprot:scaffold7388_cov399-Prasinococcus_capsulatus_cf.AAC.5